MLNPMASVVELFRSGFFGAELRSILRDRSELGRESGAFIFRFTYF